MSRMNDGRESLRNGARLRQIISRSDEPTSSGHEQASAFEQVTRQMVVDLHGEIAALRARLDHLFAVVVGAVVVDLLLRLAGWG